MPNATLTYRVGDATAPDASKAIIAHVCNNAGGWGRGFVMSLSARWPEPEAKYREWFADRYHNNFDLGAVQLVGVAPGLWVANMVAQHGIGWSQGHPPIRYDALETALGRLADHAQILHASVHMPRIGCNLAGGQWEFVEPLIYAQLVDKDIDTFVYDLPART